MNIIIDYGNSRGGDYMTTDNSINRGRRDGRVTAR